MAASNKTPNYELPLFTQADPTSWMADFNPAMTKIDTAIKQAADAADQAATTANGANTTAQAAQTQAQQAASGVSALQGTVAGQSQQIQQLQTDIQGVATPDQIVIGKLITFKPVMVQRDAANNRTIYSPTDQNDTLLTLFQGGSIFSGNVCWTGSQITGYTHLLTNQEAQNSPGQKIFVFGVAPGNVFNLSPTPRSGSATFTRIREFDKAALVVWYDSAANVTFVGVYTAASTNVWDERELFSPIAIFPSLGTRSVTASYWTGFTTSNLSTSPIQNILGSHV